MLAAPAGIDHRDDLQGGFVRDAAAAHHPGGTARLFLHTGGQYAAAVHQDLGPFERGETLAELPEQFFVVHDVSAYFDDFDHRLCNIFLMTVCTDTTRLAASGITILRSESITSSETIMFRRTGRQCMK